MKYYKLLAITGLVASLALPAFAQDMGGLRVDNDTKATVSGGILRDDTKADLHAKADADDNNGLRANVAVKTALKLNARRQVFENAVGVRMRGIFDRLTALQGRIGARIDTAKAAGANVASAESSLQASRDHSAEAQKIALSLQAKLDASTDSTDKAKLRAEIKNDFDSIKTHLKEAYESLRDSWDAVVKAEASVSASAHQ
jgi:hypothetical protein